MTGVQLRVKQLPAGLVGQMFRLYDAQPERGASVGGVTTAFADVCMMDGPSMAMLGSLQARAGERGECSSGQAPGEPRRARPACSRSGALASGNGGSTHAKFAVVKSSGGEAGLVSPVCLATAVTV